MRFAFANVAALVSWRGTSVVLNIDDPWDANDPFVRERLDLFSDRPSFIHRTAGHEPGRVVDVTPDRRRGNRG